MGKRSYKGEKLRFKQISEDSNLRRWKAVDMETKSSIIVYVPEHGPAYFSLCDNPTFPYSEAFCTVAQLEGKKLTFNVRKRSMYNDILKKVEKIHMVSCVGECFQIYYLNP